MTASLDAINLLRQGARAWNDSRRTVPADLTHVEIRNAPLAGVDLRGVDFDGASFVSVDLREARLDRARMNGVQMKLVRLDGASLSGAETKGTDLDQSCLRRANLERLDAFLLKVRRSDMTGVRLRDASLRSSHIYNCRMTDADVYGIRPDDLTLKRVVATRDVLAELSAKGCGVELPNQPIDEDLVDWSAVAIPDRDGEAACILHAGRAYWFAVDRWDIFISHATADKVDFAEPLKRALTALGQRVWMDTGEIKASDALEEVIGFGTRAANFAVAVLSPNYFGRPWTERELDLLERKEMILVLHGGMTLADLAQIRPALLARRTIDGAAGSAAVATEIVEAITRPPGRF